MMDIERVSAGEDDVAFHVVDEVTGIAKLFIHGDLVPT